MKITICVLGGGADKQAKANKVAKTFKENNPSLIVNCKEPSELYEELQEKGVSVDKVLIVNLLTDSRGYKESFGSMPEMIEGISQLLGKKHQLILCDRKECMKEDYNAVCVGCSNVRYHNFDSLTPSAIYNFVFGGKKSGSKHVSKQFNQAVSEKSSEILKSYQMEEAPVDDEEEEAPISRGGFFSGLKDLLGGKKKAKSPVRLEEDDEDDEDEIEEMEEYENDEEMLPIPDEEEENEEDVEEVLPCPNSEEELVKSTLGEKVSVDSFFGNFEEEETEPVKPTLGEKVSVDSFFGNFEEEKEQPTVDEIIDEYPSSVVESPYANLSKEDRVESNPINTTNAPVSSLGEDFDSLNRVDSDIQADIYQSRLDRQTEVMKADNTATELISDARSILNTVEGHNKHLSVFTSKGENSGVNQKETLRKLRKTTKILTPDEQILRQHRIVFVTGEHNSGVSSLVSSIGYCTASMGKKVLIIDMDLINRTQSQVYENTTSNSNSYSGLVPALNQWSSLNYYAYKTAVPGLSTLGVDITDSDNFKYRSQLNYQNFTALVTSASQDYHLVVVDLPFEVFLANQQWVSVAHEVFYVLENDSYGIVSMLNALCLDNFNNDRNSFFNTINKLSFVFSKFNDESVFNEKVIDCDNVSEIIEYYLGEDAVDYTNRKWIAEIPYYKELANQIARHTPACRITDEYKEICCDIIRNWG